MIGRIKGLTVRNILVAELKRLGADGLAGDECGCSIDDLCPCESSALDCVAARFIGCSECGKTECGYRSSKGYCFVPMEAGAMLAEREK